MEGIKIIYNVHSLLEKGYDPNELAEKLSSPQLYECFEELVKHGLKATDELGRKICDWQYFFMSEGFVYPKFKTNYYVLDSDGFGYIHDEKTSLPLLEFGGYREREDGLVYESGNEYYFALITIASHIDSILKCGFSKEIIAEWFLDSGNFDDDELTPYELIEDTAQYRSFLKIMSCGKKYAKHVIKFFFSSSDPGTNTIDKRNCSKFNMFIEALKSFVDAGIKKEFLIDCISEACQRSLAFYLYESETDEVWDLLDIPVEKVMTKKMFNDSKDDGVLMAWILSSTIGYYGFDRVRESMTAILPDIINRYEVYEELKKALFGDDWHD